MRAAIGSARHRVTLEAPGPPVDTPDGGWTEGWQPLDPPTWDCSIESASARAMRDLETVAAGTVLAQATHVLAGRFHPGVTTKARALFEGRVFNVIYVDNRDERDIETRLVCAEVVA